jgi:hypothetical protein
LLFIAFALPLRRAKPTIIKTSKLHVNTTADPMITYTDVLEYDALFARFIERDTDSATRLRLLDNRVDESVESNDISVAII